jgi:hypothetical protein
MVHCMQSKLVMGCLAPRRVPMAGAPAPPSAQLELFYRNDMYTKDWNGMEVHCTETDEDS